MNLPRIRLRGGQSCRLALLLFFVVCLTGPIRAETLQNDHLGITVDPSGAYQIVSAGTGWTLAGKLPGPANVLKTEGGADAIGKYRQLAFAWADGEHGFTGFIRLYSGSDLVLFSDTLNQPEASPAAPFPDFTSIPADWFHFSYRDSNFSPPQFNLGTTTSSPWLFFDREDHALLISAASHFLVASLTGDGKTRVASGFTPTLAGLPAGFTQQTLLAFGSGINATYELWGHALTDLQGKKRPSNDADASLKYYGYWTDNGADYYYDYDQDKGYAGTLQEVIDKYRQEKIPVRYLQLDSWWYHKTYTYYDGKEGHSKNSKLPAGDWNCYGGLLDYTASPFLFPEGLARYQQALGLPLITHNRWIDPASPYHQHFKISGIAAVDPAFWDQIAAYLKASGVVTYEQDWLSAIFPYSPALSSTPDSGDAFLDQMARACAAQHITMQYCMALPRCFLQGSKYDNLTTIRTSDDRFCPPRYHDFLYTSRFATALGMWPWTDVFMSGETNNLLISNLSAGPVGTGDALGKEDAANIRRTTRADGVIVKPDTALVPVDSAYVAEAEKRVVPLVSTAWTEHAPGRTVYAVILDPPKASNSPFTLTPADLGSTGPVCVYDDFAGAARWLEKGQPYTGQVGSGGLTYLIAAPVGPSGIAFLGDRDRFVSVGKQRIRAIDDQPKSPVSEVKSLVAEVLFAAGEEAVTLHGFCHQAPAASVENGSSGPVEYDAATGHFTVTVRPQGQDGLEAGVDPVRRVQVTLWPKSG